MAGTLAQRRHRVEREPPSRRGAGRLPRQAQTTFAGVRAVDRPAARQ
jgi:hypothetical protein